MKLNLRKENMNFAYVMSLAAQSGWDVELAAQDDKGYDVKLTKVIDYTDPNGLPASTPVSLIIQLKCTERPARNNEVRVGYRFHEDQLAKYRRIRGTNWAIAFMVVPGNTAEWIELVDAEDPRQHRNTTIRHSCYIRVITEEGNLAENLLLGLADDVIDFNKGEDQFTPQFLAVYEQNLTARQEQKVEDEIRRQARERDVRNRE